MFKKPKLTLSELKIIMSDLIREPRIKDFNYKSAYIDGVLDMFNRIKDKVKED
jgi:hypothetical protein